MPTDEWCCSARSLNPLATPVLVTSPMHVPLRHMAGLLMWLRQRHQDSPPDNPSLVFMGVLMAEKEGRSITFSGSLHCPWSARGPQHGGPHHSWDMDGDMSSMEGHNKGMRCCCNCIQEGSYCPLKTHDFPTPTNPWLTVLGWHIHHAPDKGLHSLPPNFLRLSN